MSEIEGLRADIAKLTENIMDIKSILGELQAKTHAPENCKLNGRVNALEKQQSRWAGGLMVLLALISLLTFLLSKIWK